MSLEVVNLRDLGDGSVFEVVFKVMTEFNSVFFIIANENNLNPVKVSNMRSVFFFLEKNIVQQHTMTHEKKYPILPKSKKYSMVNMKKL